MGSAKTVFSLKKASCLQVTADAVLVPVYQEKGPAAPGNASDKKPEPRMLWTDELHALDQAISGLLSVAIEQEKFDGGYKKTLTFWKLPAFNVQARRIVIVGLGLQEKLTPQRWDEALLAGLKSALSLKEIQSAAIVIPPESPLLPQTTVIPLSVDDVYQASYRSSEAKEAGPEVKEVFLLLDHDPSRTEQDAVKLGEAIGQARKTAKDLVNRPANLKTTQSLADVAETLSKRPGITVTIEKDVQWIRDNMPTFFEVAKGNLASDPPKWITLRYQKPSAAGGKMRRIALIGKSVIFDTGGYQVKTENYMNTMKGDMTGGALVLGVFQALSDLQPDGIEVYGFLAVTPNKIDSDAMLPDSIVPSACGKKIEIRHTDAEGRLTLIDAVSLAEKVKPDALVTIATLTGSASRAVGRHMALMGNNIALRNQVEIAARTFGDPVQTLDVIEEDYEDIKSRLDGADLINTTYNKAKARGAQSAAAFVMSGASEDLPIAHLDIAGADMTEDEKATGYGQRTLIRFLLNEAAS